MIASSDTVETGPIRVLLVDDDEDDFVLTRDLLADLGTGRYQLEWVTNYPDAERSIGEHRHDVYFLDFNLGERNGLDLLRKAIASGCRAPLIVLTGQGHRAIDVEAMRSGAADYIPKSRMDAALLERTIRFALARKRAEDALRKMHDELESRVAERTSDLERSNVQLRLEAAERRRAEEERARALADERRARAEAEEANRAKDRLISRVSHELRTPLNPVLLAASALVESEETPETMRPFLELTVRNVSLEARIIDDLLDATQVARGSLQIVRELVDLHQVAEAALATCRAEIDSAGLQAEVAWEAASFHVDGDPFRLQQVVWTLLRNAVKFRKSGGTIRLSSWNEFEDPAATLCLAISDSGIGIDRPSLHRIFEPFDPPPGTQQYGGLGLGLTIARAVVEAHGGSIVAESAGPGLGARFVVRIAATSPRADAADPGFDARGFAPRRILIVEDDPASLKLLGRLLRSEGHEVIEADSAEVALEEVLRQPPDVIVSDLGLPGLSGFELLPRLRETCVAPAIAVTGLGTDDDRARAFQVGFAGHLTKPIEIGALREAFRRLA